MCGTEEILKEVRRVARSVNRRASSLDLVNLFRELSVSSEFSDLSGELPDPRDPVAEIVTWFELNFPHLNDLVQLSLIEGKLVVNLNRKMCFIQGLCLVDDLQLKYGSNRLLDNKSVRLAIDYHHDQNSLTFLRANLASDVLHQLIAKCGAHICCSGDVDYDMIISSRSTHPTHDGKVIVLVSNVVTKNGQLTVKDYQKIRTDEIVEIRENRLEANTASDHDEILLKAITVFDLFKCSITKKLVLHLGKDCDASERMSCKGALFVLYNYARIVKLLSTFDELVRSKVIPELPSLNEVDFGLLTLDMEWKLMFEFIIGWPEVVELATYKLIVGRPKLHLLIYFLLDVSETFSRYYSRTRILTEPRPHLIPVMHARIHMLRALSVVYESALKTTGITPLSRM